MSGYEKLDVLEKKLSAMVESGGVTQEAIFEEMTDGERKVLENLAGIDYVKAMLNRIGVPIGKQQQQRDES